MLGLVRTLMQLTNVCQWARIDNCAQIWGMDGPYCDNKYVCEDERYVFTRGIVR